MVLTATMSVMAQVVEVYENGKLKTTYYNSKSTQFRFVFKELGDDKEINGHEYVEIGGLKWATMNVGATSVAESAETAYGDFYAWGETDTYYNNVTSSDVTWGKYSNNIHISGNKTSYDWTNYNGKSTFCEWEEIPYDNDRTLTLEHDVAQKEWGGSWRMPTFEEMRSLYYACGGTKNTINIIGNSQNGSITLSKGGIYWIEKGLTVDGTTYRVAGALFVATADIRQRVFFPAAGNIKGKERQSAGTLATYWSSTLDSNNQQNASELYINEKGIYHHIIQRYYGFTIRPVSD